MENSVEERRKLRRKKIRKRRLLISFFVFLLISLITLVIMCFTIFFPIQKITIKGSELYTKKQITKACGIVVGDNLFAISESKLQERARMQLPYVDSITIERKIPDTLILTVKDAQEYACYNSEDKYFVVSKKGYVLAEYSEPPQNVFQITSGKVSCEIGKPVKFEDENKSVIINNLINNLDLNEIKINSIDASNIIEIKAVVNDIYTVNFGTEENLDRKIAHLSGMIKSIGDRKGNIDLSMWTPSNTQGSFVAEKG